MVRGVVWGVFLLASGLAFAVAPVAVARVTGYIRWVPYPESPTRQQMAYYRVAGVVVAMAGIALILLLR